VAALDYLFPWDRLIASFKFGGNLALAGTLADLMGEALRRVDHDASSPVDWVVPMPLSARRLRERGFNQSWELAHRVAMARGLKARHDLLWRWRETDHQTGLSRDERGHNLRGAFMPAPGARAALAGRHVALVDDVMTTGASAAEATRALLEGGAASVQLWLLARTPMAD
jgi:ComF family protein